MAFKENPLSLSLSQTAFEEWLRDNGHLETLDRTRLDHHLRLPTYSSFSEFSKAVKSNPFMTLTVEDLLKKLVPWTGEFFDCGFGPGEMYSWPRSISQAKLRMDKNIRRYIGNYVILVVIVFLILLYQMPMALVGIISVILVWNALRRAGDEWGLEGNGYCYRALAFLGNTDTIFFVWAYLCVSEALCVSCSNCGLDGVLQNCACTFLGWDSKFLVVTVHSYLRRITPPKVVSARAVNGSAQSPLPLVERKQARAPMKATKLKE